LNWQNPGSLLVILAVTVGVLWVGRGGAQEDRVPPPVPDETTPTLAVEDTFPVPMTTLPEHLVVADRVTLDEILRRVAEGEARRDSLMEDQAYTLLVKIVSSSGDGSDTSKTKIDREYASRVYKKRPDKLREVPLRSRGDEDIEVRAEANMGERIVSFAFEPRSRSKYHFEILERAWVGGHVIYKIEFKPRSQFDPLPSGLVWVDTNEFVIVREEFWYREQSPAPMFFKSIDNCVVERSRVDGRWWVMTRFLARIETTSALRLMGRIAGKRLSDNIDLALEKIDWEVNRGLPDSLFVAESS
jgi:hypothetical protein